jgi:translation initiation factor IF-3
MITRAYTPPNKKVVAPVAEVLRNNKIKYPTLRVVYKDRDTGENTHKVLSRNDALDLARDYATDLILGD